VSGPVSPPDTGVELSSIAQIALRARDLERAAAFYRDVLGLRLLFAPPGLAFFDCGGVRLMLGGAESEEFDHPSSIIYFRVSDIHQAHATLAERGAAFRDTPHCIARLPGAEIWMTFFSDSEGNTLALTSEVAAA